VPSIFDQVYLGSPRLVQDLLVSLKGFQLERQRRAGNYARFREEIRTRDRYSAEEVAAYQLRRLNELLAIAGGESRYYSQAFRDAGVPGIQLSRLGELAQIPLLPKSALRTDPRALVPSRFNPDKLIAIQTTGTTGSPVTIYSTVVARQENYAHWDHLLESVGLDSEGRRAVFGGRLLQRAEDMRPPFWRRSRFQNTVLFSSYHLTADTFPEYLAALRRFRPAMIEGYPSAIARLATLLQERPDHGLRPTVIVTSSETLLPSQREVIEAAFACPVCDFYGAAEMCVFVAQCRLGSYHVRSDYGIVELLDGDRPVAPGEEGEVVCTGFINLGMPLIRYRIGDYARWSEGRCECGLATPVLAEIIGRMDDVVVTPEGRHVGRLSPVLKGFPVEEGQYIQETDGVLHVLLVTAPGFHDGVIPAIEQSLRKRVGPTIPVVIRQVPAIERGPGGKFRAVISRFRP
jgi:phenylacetate-CoA ligase